jgi:hypothetical protein
MVNFAKALGPRWKAIHIAVNPEKAAGLRAKWQRRIGEGELVILESPYRQLAEPLRDYIVNICDIEPNTFVHVIMGHLVMDTFWEQALHQNSAYLLNLALGGLNRVVVTMVPYQIHHRTDAPPPPQEVGAGQAQVVESKMSRQARIRTCDGSA